MSQKHYAFPGITSILIGLPNYYIKFKEDNYIKFYNIPRSNGDISFRNPDQSNLYNGHEVTTRLSNRFMKYNINSNTGINRIDNYRLFNEEKALYQIKEEFNLKELLVTVNGSFGITEFNDLVIFYYENMNLTDKMLYKGHFGINTAFAPPYYNNRVLNIGPNLIEGNVKAIYATKASNSTYLVTLDNNLYVTGENQQYELGLGHHDDVYVWTKVTTPGLVNNVDRVEIHQIYYRFNDETDKIRNIVLVITLNKKLFMAGNNRNLLATVYNTTMVNSIRERYDDCIDRMHIIEISQDMDTDGEDMVKMKGRFVKQFNDPNYPEPYDKYPGIHNVIKSWTNISAGTQFDNAVDRTFLLHSSYNTTRGSKARLYVLTTFERLYYGVNFFDGDLPASVVWTPLTVNGNETLVKSIKMQYINENCFYFGLKAFCWWDGTKKDFDNTYLPIYSGATGNYEPDRYGLHDSLTIVNSTSNIIKIFDDSTIDDYNPTVIDLFSNPLFNYNIARIDDDGLFEFIYTKDSKYYAFLTSTPSLMYNALLDNVDTYKNDHILLKNRYAITYSPLYDPFYTDNITDEEELRAKQLKINNRKLKYWLDINKQLDYLKSNAKLTTNKSQFTSVLSVRNDYYIDSATNYIVNSYLIDGLGDLYVSGVGTGAGDTYWTPFYTQMGQYSLEKNVKELIKLKDNSTVVILHLYSNNLWLIDRTTGKQLIINDSTMNDTFASKISKVIYTGITTGTLPNMYEFLVITTDNRIYQGGFAHPHTELVFDELADLKLTLIDTGLNRVKNIYRKNLVFRRDESTEKAIGMVDNNNNMWIFNLLTRTATNRTLPLVSEGISGKVTSIIINDDFFFGYNGYYIVITDTNNAFIVKDYVISSVDLTINTLDLRSRVKNVFKLHNRPVYYIVDIENNVWGNDNRTLSGADITIPAEDAADTMILQTYTKISSLQYKFKEAVSFRTYNNIIGIIDTSNNFWVFSDEVVDGTSAYYSSISGASSHKNAPIFRVNEIWPQFTTFVKQVIIEYETDITLGKVFIEILDLDDDLWIPEHVRDHINNRTDNYYSSGTFEYVKLGTINPNLEKKVVKFNLNWEYDAIKNKKYLSMFVIDKDGSLYVGGANRTGQLGIDLLNNFWFSTDRFIKSLLVGPDYEQRLIENIKEVEQVYLTNSNTKYLSSVFINTHDGRSFIKGLNHHGQLGIGRIPPNISDLWRLDELNDKKTGYAIAGVDENGDPIITNIPYSDIFVNKFVEIHNKEIKGKIRKIYNVYQDCEYETVDNVAMTKKRVRRKAQPAAAVGTPLSNEHFAIYYSFLETDDNIFYCGTMLEETHFSDEITEYTEGGYAVHDTKIVNLVIFNEWTPLKEKIVLSIPDRILKDLDKLIGNEKFTAIAFGSKNEDKEVVVSEDHTFLKNEPYIGDLQFKNVNYGDLVLIDGKYVPYNLKNREKAARYNYGDINKIEEAEEIYKVRIAVKDKD
jgi:hypothetical protein